MKNGYLPSNFQMQDIDQQFEQVNQIAEALEEENRKFREEIEKLEQTNQELLRENQKLMIAIEERCLTPHDLQEIQERFETMYAIAERSEEENKTLEERIKTLEKTNQQLCSKNQELIQKTESQALHDDTHKNKPSQSSATTHNPLNNALSTLKSLTNSIKKHAWHTGLFGGLKLQRRKDHSYYKVTGTAAKILTTLHTIKKEIRNNTIRSNQILRNKLHEGLSNTLDKVSDKNYKRTLDNAWTFGFFGGLTTKDSVDQYRRIFRELEELGSPSTQP